MIANTKKLLNHQEITSTILSNPLVEDCYLLTRNQRLIAYLVYTGNWNQEEIANDLESKLPNHKLPDYYIPISTIPLTNTGNVDENILKSIPIIDENLAQIAENTIKNFPQIDQIATLITPAEKENKPLHLSDLLPLKSQNNWQQNQEQETKNEINLASQTASNQLALSQGKSLVTSLSQPQTLAESLENAVKNYPNQTITYIQSNGNLLVQSYQELWQEALRIYTGLKQLNLKPQSQVILQLSEHNDLIPAFWGCILGGIIPLIISVPPTYKDLTNDVKKIAQVWELLDQPFIITNKTQETEIKKLEKWVSNQSLKLSYIEELKTHQPAPNYYQTQPDDVVFFNLTSGSTGMSKCITLTNKNLLSRARGTNIICNHKNGDIILNWLPFEHIGSISDWHIRCIEIGCQMIYVQTKYILSRPLNWLDLINQYRITHSWAPNFAYNLINESLKKEPHQIWNLDCVKFFLVAGEAVSDKAVSDFIETLNRQYNLQKTTVRPAFGMAEMGSGITYFEPTKEQPLLFHTVDKNSLNQTLKRVHPDHPQATTFTDLGLPIAGVCLRIVDHENNLLPEETIGNLQVKGDPVFPAYYKNSSANQEAFLADGWFKTGDLGFISNGHLVITGRSKETIIINGVNFYSHEIEIIVDSIESVNPSYTAACAVHDAHSNTDQLAIFFSPETLPQNKLKKLIKTIREKVINSFGVNPQYLIPLNQQEIPKTSIGKIQRSQLTKRFESGEFTPILKEIDLLLENANTIPNWFYRKIWKQRNPINLKSELCGHNTLIFLDQLGLGNHLASEIKAQNLPVITVIQGAKFAQISHNHYEIQPESKEDYELLFNTLAQQKINIDQIVHLWNYQEYQGEITNSKQLEKAQEIGIYSLLYLVQSLAKIQGSNLNTQLLFVSSHSQLVSQNDEIAYEKSPVLGLIKSINAELSWLNSRHLDLEIAPPNINSAYLIEELKVISREKEIAYRQNKRFISGLEKVNFCQEIPEQLPFKKGGIYVITGGLGGIGTPIAEYLLKNYQAQLLLIGKTPLPPKTEWDDYLRQNHQFSAKIQTLESLENIGGKVIYQAVDICDFNQLKQTITQAKNQWQGELDGIIHLAGIYQDGLILEETKDNLANILRPKMLGSWNLHQILKESQGIYISFSSLASFFGGAAIASYSASNTFLEQLNSYQNAKNLFPSYCYSWTTWQETGISKGYQAQQLTRSQGYFEMTVQQGLDSFLANLSHHHNQSIIGLDGNNAKIKRFLSLAENNQQLTAYYTVKDDANSVNLDSQICLSDPFENLYQCALFRQESFPLKDNGEIDKEQLLREIQGQDNKNWILPRNETEFQISQIWQTVLKLPKISINDNFFELGGHSLLASQVISRLSDIFSIELSLQNLLEYATIADLAEAINVLKTVEKNRIVTTKIEEDYEEGEL